MDQGTNDSSSRTGIFSLDNKSSLPSFDPFASFSEQYMKSPLAYGAPGKEQPRKIAHHQAEGGASGIPKKNQCSRNFFLTKSSKTAGQNKEVK